MVFAQHLPVGALATTAADCWRHLCYLALARYWSPVNFTAKNLPFADGGSADNLAVTPLLRRRTQKMLVLVAASNSVTNTQDAADWGGEFSSPVEHAARKPPWLQHVQGSCTYTGRSGMVCHCIQSTVTVPV